MDIQVDFASIASKTLLSVEKAAKRVLDFLVVHLERSSSLLLRLFQDYVRFICAAAKRQEEFIIKCGWESFFPAECWKDPVSLAQEQAFRLVQQYGKLCRDNATKYLLRFLLTQPPSTPHLVYLLSKISSLFSSSSTSASVVAISQVLLEQDFSELPLDVSLFLRQTLLSIPVPV